ncbi:MAG: mannose-1-phosphate guanylyltransferase, partial [Proteobacteria bacterium]|nr:mannose-1-phosphate guanylyltransferase [Pseudomonadota bacterium]
VAHLGEKIVDHLNDACPECIRIDFSHEPKGALETAGGIHHALDLIESDPFIVVNADIWTDFPFTSLPDAIGSLAHLVLVANPPHHPEGDFVLHERAVQMKSSESLTLTYSGIGLYQKRLFVGCETGRFPLAPVLNRAAQMGELSGEVYRGTWMDIGTPQRLMEARHQVHSHPR